MLNKDELILDRVRSATFKSLSTGELLLRMTQIEDASINTTAEGEEVTDAVGALITTLYRAKKATFSGTNSLFSLGLAAAQFGTERVIADTTNKITTQTYEILKVDSGKITLTHTPTSDITSIYSMISGDIGVEYKAGAAVSAEEFLLNGAEIETPTVFTDGTSVFVEYEYETEDATSVANSASKFPEAGKLAIYVYFRDKCTDELYSGVVLCPKAKLNPESVEIALTTTGKHAFEFTMMKDYCADEGEDQLFSIIVSK